ncbi:MAG TPA: tRNA lysidine(34) synthetase TilS [Vicinamibacterales bacterium]|nr:tRNA lysidine(34) synthetase TilS [Vicinamibacterales bacterium]
MRDLHARVARALREDCRVHAGDRIAVAISGGSDSVALLWLMRELAPDLGLELAGLIHINHQLRGAESDHDEAFCRALAERMALPIAVASIDVAGDAASRRVSIEVAARDARYAFFPGAAASLGATVVLTGHTLDDQAETVMLRLLRGAGTRGLSGIRPRRELVARPMLQVRRAEARDYLLAFGEAWREDASNLDTAIARNRIRHELMPVLESVAPGAAVVLARTAGLAQDDEDFLMEAAIKNRPALVLSERGVSEPVELDAAALSVQPAAVGRRFIRAVAAQVAPASSLSSAHLAAVLGLAGTDKSGGHLDLPGLIVEKHGAMLSLRPKAAAPDPVSKIMWEPRALEVPGAVNVTEASVMIVATRGPGPVEFGAREACIAAVQEGAIRLPLFVRNRRPGDRFRPLGAPGRRKLQDLLVDRKVPRRERDRVPVVVDADDRIVWVAGLAVAHDCRVTAPEDGVLILEQRSIE